MENTRTDQPAPHAGEIEKGAGLDGKSAPQPKPKDANSPASKPQGTLEDQVTTMESEGQAQPQEGDRTPEELEREGFPKKLSRGAKGAGDPLEDSEEPGKAPSPATADDESQRPEGRLEEVEGLTDNSAGG